MSDTTRAGWPRDRRITVRDLQAAKERSARWAMLTAYDALTAGVFDESGVQVLLVGDSAANVVQGHGSPWPGTLPIEVDELLPMVRAVVRGTRHSLVVADLPFGSYEASAQQAFSTAARMVKEGGAHAVKLEGGARMLRQVELLAGNGVPVMAHLGLTPQSVNSLGGYRVQGRGEAGHRLASDAKALQAAGAFAVVLELVPADLAAEVTDSLEIPTVGIGAGPHTDAQVLVWQDMAGLTPDPAPRFVRRYADLRAVLSAAATDFRADVEEGRYPGPEHTFS